MILCLLVPAVIVIETLLPWFNRFGWVEMIMGKGEVGRGKEM